MSNTKPNNKVPLAARVDNSLFMAVEQIAKDEERTVSKVVERLLRTHPRIQPILEAETAEATA